MSREYGYDIHLRREKPGEREPEIGRRRHRTYAMPHRFALAKEAFICYKFLV